MVDVTAIEDVEFGDKVVIFGRDGKEFLSVDKLGELSGRFNYEFVCVLNKTYSERIHPAWRKS